MTAILGASAVYLLAASVDVKVDYPETENSQPEDVQPIYGFAVLRQLSCSLTPSYTPASNA